MSDVQTATVEEIKAHIQKFSDRLDAIPAELDAISSDIADAIIAGRSTSALEKKQADLQAEAQRCELIIPKLEDQLPAAEGRKLKALYDSEVDKLEVMCKRISELLAKVEPLRKTLKPLEFELNKLTEDRIQLQNWTQSRARDLSNKYDYDWNELDRIAKERLQIKNPNKDTPEDESD